MKNTIKIRRFLRTRMRFHYTWILAIVLISWAASTQFSTVFPLFSRIGFGLAASLLYLFAIFVREIILLLLAVYKGILIEHVTVFAFGGLVRFDRETTTPSHELLLAVAGTLCNLVITLIFYLGNILINSEQHVVVDVILKWLAFLFFTLSLFHLLPAFPLEGGRFLHVVLWKTFNGVQKATRLAGWIGWSIGLLVAAGGALFLVFTAERFTGVFFLSLGLILQNAATHSRRQFKKDGKPKEPVLAKTADPLPEP
jgi:Zn-dependent protease